MGGRRLSDHTNMVSVDNDLHISESAASADNKLPIQHDRILEDLMEKN